MRNAARLLAFAALAASLSACDLGLPAGRTPHREGNRLDYKPVQMKPLTVDSVPLKVRTF